jgi:hypothetical protein
MKPPAPTGNEAQSGTSHGAVATGKEAAADRRKDRAINGAIGIGSGVVSDEVAEWAKSMWTLLFGERGLQTPSKPVWSPYSDEDSNIEIAGENAGSIKLDDLMTDALAPLGYHRVDKLIYRADWSTADVEHVLSLDTYGNPKVFLHGDAGLRNKDAETFAQQCHQRYVDERVLKSRRETAYVDPPWFCPMNFSIGKLFGWPGRAALNTADFSSQTLAGALAEPIRATLIPYLSRVTTLQGLLEFLERDEPPMQWTMRGPYYRAALVAYLAAALGVDQSKTRATLLTHSRLYPNMIDMTRLTPETYVDHLLEDAATAITARG